MSQTADASFEGSRWKDLYKIGGAATIIMLALIPIQIVILVAYPPPETAEGFFALFQKNWFLGLLSLDLLYILNNMLLAIIYLALFPALKRINESLAVIALMLGLLGIAAYFASNTAFEMMSLSRQFAAATTEAQQSVFLAAGQAMLAIYKGTAFDVYYVLNGAALLITAVVMLRGTIFSRTTGYAGLVAGILMIVPSTAGTIGLIFSLVSLVPWMFFSVLVARKLFELGRAASAAR